MIYDVIIIGGGPSGLMASVAASQFGGRVLLVDKGNKIGRKLAISGGGRCNVTNRKPISELIQNIPGNGRFLYSALSHFGNEQIIEFFEQMGIELKEEDRGRMFPINDRAQTVVQALINKVVAQGVEIRVNTPVKEVVYDQNQVVGMKLSDDTIVKGKAVVIATGGMSVPHTGSTGDGYPWAEAAGHTITELYPTEVPITSVEPFIVSRELQGLSLRDITLTVWAPNGKKNIEHEGDLIFTHFGISGPAVLKCSQFVVKLRKKFKQANILLTIDLFPQLTTEQLQQQLKELGESEPKKAFKNVVKKWIPERLIPLALQKADINEQVTYAEIRKQSILVLANILKKFPIEANGTLTLKEAFVTGGGVHLKEIDPKTMQSKKTDGLFFCGEILDVHGYTGGYNITAAFSTGYTAGEHARKYSQLIRSTEH